MYNSKFGIIMVISLLTLSGCGVTVESISDKASVVIDKKNEVVDKAKEIRSDVNEVTTTFDKKVQAVKKSNVYENEFTFEDLFDETLKNAKWESDKEEVRITGDPKEFLFDPVFNSNSDLDTERQEILASYLVDDSVSFTFIFPSLVDTVVPSVNVPIFSELYAYITIDGTDYEVNGQELISILSELYKVVKN